LRVLIADDDTATRKALESTLKKWGYEVVVARDGNEAWQVLKREDSPQLAILDWMMPGMDGPEVCRKMRRERKGPYVFVLLLTAKSQRGDIIEGMDAGADDYITKPFDLNELRVRLRAGSRILNLQADLISAREALRVQATHDPLTGLWNRAAILDILRRELERSKREGSPLCVAMADLDHFKRINDTYGHMAGDSVLCEAARRMIASLRVYDAVGRYGGEEFLFVVVGCDARRGLELAERIRKRVGKEAISIPQGLVFVTISLGVATTEGIEGVEMDALVGAADAALYRAKSAGRNCVKLAEADDEMRDVPPLTVKSTRREELAQ